MLCQANFALSKPSGSLYLFPSTVPFAKYEPSFWLIYQKFPSLTGISLLTGYSKLPLTIWSGRLDLAVALSWLVEDWISACWPASDCAPASVVESASVESSSGVSAVSSEVSFPPSSESFTTLFVVPVVSAITPVVSTALAVPVRPAPNAAAAVRPAISLVRNPIPLILIN